MRSCVLTVIIIFIFLSFSAPAFADKIYLKNGKVYDGKLLGKSEKRYLFSVDVDGIKFNMSFFPEEVEKLELEKKTVDEQIPYLKDVASFKVDAAKTYEISLYGEPKNEQAKDGNGSEFSQEQLQGILSKEESDYYNQFTFVLKKYVDKFNFILGIYSDMTSATRDDFAKARQYLEEMVRELSALAVPELFKRAHTDYVESLRSSFLGFKALEHGMLEQAQAQIKQSEDLRQRALLEFRNTIMQKSGAAEEAATVQNEESAE